MPILAGRKVVLLEILLLLITALHPCAAKRVLNSFVPKKHEEFDRLAYDGAGFNISGRRRLASYVDHRVKALPGLSPRSDIVHYAGHITVDAAKGGNLFYWLFDAQKVDPAKAPVLVWINGGPGCSSMDGLFLELGPFRLEPSGNIKINPSSWHYAANLLFVDQPVGTGLSYTKKGDGYANSDAAVNDHFYKFLVGFFNLHDRFTYMKDGRRYTRKFFISGESHAGHYIPSIAAYIRQKNKALLSGTPAAGSAPGELLIDMQGIALGNPWIDPMNQYDVSDFAHGLGIISHGQRNRLKEMERQCQSHLKQGKFNTKICFDLLDDVVDSSSLSGSLKVLMYDARKYVTHTQVFPPGHEAVESYLNRADVRVAIHATNTPHKYVECADPPFNALSHQDGKGVTKELAEVLDDGLRVLVYSGQFDLICHHLGTEKALQNLVWSGQSDWLKAQPGVWIVNKQPAGHMKAFKNLQYLLVLGCGHMVPMDVPAVALDMITRFLEPRTFGSGYSKVGTSVQPIMGLKNCPTAAADVSTTSMADNEGGQGVSNFNNNPYTERSKKLSRKAMENRKAGGSGGGGRGRVVKDIIDIATAAATDSGVNSNNQRRYNRLQPPRNEETNNRYLLSVKEVVSLDTAVAIHLAVTCIPQQRLVFKGTTIDQQQQGGGVPSSSNSGRSCTAVEGIPQYTLKIHPGDRTLAIPTQTGGGGGAENKWERRTTGGSNDGSINGTETTTTGEFSRIIIVPAMSNGLPHVISVIQATSSSSSVVDTTTGITAAPSTTTTISVTPGCLSSSLTQCCGNGVCAVDGSSRSAKCFCHTGYAGTFCDKTAGRQKGQSVAHLCRASPLQQLLVQLPQSTYGNNTSSSGDSNLKSSTAGTLNVLSASGHALRLLNTSMAMKFCPLANPNSPALLSDIVCFTTIQLVFGPLTSLPWAAAAATSSSSGTMTQGILTALKEVLSNDMKSALSKVIDAIGKKNAVVMPSKPAHLRRDDDTLSISASIDITDISDDLEDAAAVGVGALQQEDSSSMSYNHHPLSDGQLLVEESEDTKKIMKGYVTIRGQRDDVLDAIETLMAQAGDATSVLRRGLLTSAMHPGIQIARRRRSKRGRAASTGTSSDGESEPSVGLAGGSSLVFGFWTQLYSAIVMITSLIASTSSSSVYTGDFSSTYIVFGLISLLGGVCLAYYIYIAVVLKRSPFNTSTRRHHASGSSSSNNNKGPTTSSGSGPSTRPRGFRIN